MLKDIQDNILTQLTGTTGVKTLDVWAGAVEELLKQPQLLPALNLIYQGCGFKEKQVIGANIAPNDMTFMFVITNKNLKSRRTCSEDIYTVIEAVRAKLIGHQIGAYGYLWPVSEELIEAESGTMMYGLIYKVTSTKTGG